MVSKTLFVFGSCILSTLVALPPVHAQNRELLGEYRIGIVGRDQNDMIYQATHLGARNAALELSQQYSIDVEMLVFTPVLEQGGSQVTSLAELFIEDADGLIISPAPKSGVRPALQFAIEQGQSVVFFENALEEVDPLAALVADEFAAGRLAGESMLKALPNQARVAILTSEEPGPKLTERLSGLRSALGYRRIETVVTCEPDYKSAIAAIRATEEADHDDRIGGWVFLDDWPLQGLPALPWKPGDVPLVAIQSSPTAFLYIDQGYLNALIVHPYYDWGYESVEILINKLHNKIDPENTTRVTTPKVIDFRNIEEYRQAWKGWLQ